MDKDKKVIEWFSDCPYLGSLEPLLFNYLKEVNGAIAIKPIANSVNQTFIDGTRLLKYQFAVSANFTTSDLPDDVNVEIMELLSNIQDWIYQQELGENYPDFGGNCYGYELTVLADMPQLAVNLNENMAEFRVMAQLEYYEKR